MKKKTLFWLLPLCFALLLLPVRADETTVLPPEYTEMLEGLPDALRESLPEEMFTADPTALSSALETLLSPAALLRTVLNTFADRPAFFLNQLLRLLGVLLIRAVWNCFAAHLRASPMTSALRLLCRVVMVLILIGGCLTLLQTVTAFYEDLRALTASFLPLMGAMYAMGGNVSTAVLNESTLILSMSVTEWIGGESIVPFFSLCLSLTLLGVFDGSVAGRMEVLSGKLKKWYTTALSLVMLLLSALLAAQNTLRAKADTLALKTVRFAVSAGIPVVGGGVAEMLRTAGAGLEWMRGLVGLSGILLLLWLLIPVILSILLSRFTYSLAADLGKFLGCDEESRLLGEIAGLYGYLLAVVAVSAMTFFFALLLLMHCAAAYAG